MPDSTERLNLDSKLYVIQIQRILLLIQKIPRYRAAC